MKWSTQCQPPEGATPETWVWVAYRFHSRVTRRRIGKEPFVYGGFSSDIVCATAEKSQAVAAMVEHRKQQLVDARKQLVDARKELERAERALASAVAIASRKGGDS